MSIKGFLEVQEMQEGGPAMFTPFAVDPEGSPRRRIAPTYQPDPPPTIVLDPIAPITPTPTEDLTNFSPDPNYMGSIDMTLAQAGATKHSLGTLNPHWNQEFLSTLESEGRPETDLSRTLDRGFKALATPALAVTAALVPGAAPLAGLFSAVTGRGGSGILNSALSAMGSKPAAPQQIAGTEQFGPLAPAPIGTQETSQFTGKAITPSGIFATTPGVQYSKGDKGAPIMTSFYGTPFGADKAAIARGEAASKESVAAVSTAGVGAGMFDAFGMGGEISPNFAIGGKGSFTSFSHYGAGISQADEISIAQSGIANNSSGFETPEASKDTIDAMVSKGYNESAVVAVATGMGTEGKPDFDAGFSDPGKVICQELYDQGLLEHSIYSLDEQFGEHIRKHDSDLLEGYHTWAYDVVNAMRKSKTVTRIVCIISRPVVKHIAYKMGYPSKTLLGAVMFNVGAFVCRRLAKKETVYA